MGVRWAEGKSGVYEALGSGEGDARGGETAMGLNDGTRIIRESGLGDTEPPADVPPGEGRRLPKLPRPLKTLKLDDVRPRSLLPEDVRVDRPRAMQFMASTCAWAGLKSLAQVATTSSVGGGGDGNPVSSQ